MLGKRLFKARTIAKRRLSIMFWMPRDPKIEGILRKTCTLCSNPICCGNPRRIGNNHITKQEVLQKMKLEEEIE